MSQLRHSWGLRYGTAVFSSLVAVFLTYSLWHYIQPALYPFFLAAVMVSSWIGGFGPGLVSTALGAFFSEYFFLPPIGSLAVSWPNVGRLSYFVGVAVLICVLNAKVQNAQKRAEASAAEAQYNQTLLLQNQETLRQSEERYRLLIEGATDYAIFMLNSAGDILSWSVGAERILGYQEAEIIGQPFAILFTEEAIQQNMPGQVLKTAADQGFSKENRWHIRKDHTPFWAQCVVTALLDEAGNLKGFSKIMQDITVRRRAEEERNDLLQREQLARQEAESANRAKDEFLAVLSHELRTPLTAITGWIGMLRSGKLDAVRATVALETIERNATLQIQLVEDLLDISRIIRGDLWLEERPVDLVEVIREAIEIVQPKVEEKRLVFSFHIHQSCCFLDMEPPLRGGSISKKQQVYPFAGESTVDQEPDEGISPILVLGDSERLQQIVLNLLSNAIKFTPEEGQITVCLSVIHQPLTERDSTGGFGGRVQFQVHDTGIGIQPEFLPFVFDRFRQADSSNTRIYKGLGLGLAIAQYLVQRQGGIIQAESLGEGQGATFTVHFPLLQPTTSSYQSAPNRSIEGNLEGRRVLIVEDEADTRIWLLNVFEMHLAEAIAVASVDEAMMQLEDFSPDIVLSDIALPGKDGYAVIKALKQYERRSGKTFPAVALTAHASPEDVEKALTAGFRLHLAKPIKAEHLITAMVRVLEQCHPLPGGEP